MEKIGLNDQEVALSRQEHGSNALTEQQRSSFWKELVQNFKDPIIKILLVALAINVIFFFIGKAEWYESVGIALAVLLATLVSTYSGYKNENAFQKLQAEASKIFCKVFRNGNVAEVQINDIVKDDVVVLQPGDKIPADGIVIKGSLKVDQSALNGESAEALKVAVPEDYVEDQSKPLDTLDPHKLFRGSIVCSGEAYMKVTLVGDKTEYGKIASELQTEDDRDSPLKVKLKKLAKQISLFGYLGGAAIAISYLAHFFLTNDISLTESFRNWDAFSLVLKAVLDAIMFAVVIIVMAVPEGLPLMIAIVSSLNMRKMLADHVLVREVSGIETAGSLNILFSDKTGTITKGRLETILFASGDEKETQKFSDIPQCQKELLGISILKNTQCLISEKDGKLSFLGSNGTDRALVAYAAEDRNKDFGVETGNVIPFNSTNKYSATQITGKYNFTIIKGAAEKIIAKCNSYYDENGKVVPVSDFNKLTKKCDELAGRAIRVLALATTPSEVTELGALIDEKAPYTLVGIVGIRDEVRAEAVSAISEVNGAGVQVVMITGDRKETAVSIAKDSGLIKNDSDVVLTSDELSKLSENEVRDKIKDLRVVARALPTDKSRLVRIAQEQDLVAGMTGDGVNDSPALKKADVGFAMGSGTEVAKEASEIVILDDNFKSIEKAVLYGRTIFNSIRKFILFQLTVNVSAVIISFAMPLLGSEMPLNIIQILWINLVMDTLAALALGGEPALRRYMREKPKSRRELLVNKYMFVTMLVGSLWIFAMGLFLLFNTSFQEFLIGAPITTANQEETLLTAFFTLFIFTTIFNAFNARTESLNLFDNISKNKGFLAIMALITIIQIAMTESGRFWDTFGEIMNCNGLNPTQWLIIIGMSLTIVPIDLIKKMIFKGLSIKN